MVLVTKERNNSIEYEFEILEYIKNNPSGVSITDIANEKRYSRNTVAKYVSILELKKLIFKKKVGSSLLLYSIRNSHLPYSLILSYYKMILKGLKQFYPLDKEKMKEIGKQGAKDIKFVFTPKILKQLRGYNKTPITELHIEIFKNFYSSFDVLQPEVKISVIEQDNTKERVVLRFSNSIFLDESDDLIYHVYFVCGIAEYRISKVLNKLVRVDLEKIHIDKKAEYSYFDLSIESL